MGDVAELDPAIPGPRLPRPRSPWSIHRILVRRGHRQLVFLPLGVLKIGRTPGERQQLDIEGRCSDAAARHPFWKGLAVRTTFLAGAGLAMWRYPAVAAADLAPVQALVEARLFAMAGYPRRPMIEEFAGRAVMGHLDADERTRLAGLVGAASLPRTSMHGDLHFLNFVRDGRGYRIIDWEHFDAGGSYVFDYLDFQVQLEQATRRRVPWPAFLSGLDAGHPAVGKAARAADVDPLALLFHYLVIRTDITFARNSATTGGDRGAIIDELRRRIAGGA